MKSSLSNRNITSPHTYKWPFSPFSDSEDVFEVVDDDLD